VKVWQKSYVKFYFGEMTLRRLSFQQCHRRCMVVIHRGLQWQLCLSFVSRWCHFDVDRDVSTAHCWSPQHDVDWAYVTLCSTLAVCDWCISSRSSWIEMHIVASKWNNRAWRQKDSIAFIVQTLSAKLWAKNAKNGQYALTGAPLRRDTMASHDRVRPTGARQNLALYYNHY